MNVGFSCLNWSSNVFVFRNSPYLSSMISDETYIQRCIDLALNGLGKVRPNPMVGAVVVCNGRIIGEGYHEQYGGPHAEVNAIESVQDKKLLQESTVYVSLEPCAHHGKTPPCADLLIRSKVKKVVIGCKDSYAEVSGKGIEKLKSAGIEVVVGVLEEACRELNKRFFTFHERKRPYVILKWAQTADGFMDKQRLNDEQGINWITAPETKRLVHKWRSQEAGILVGKQTVLNDNPELTVREWIGQHPTRIVLDSQLALAPESRIFNEAATTLVLNTLLSEKTGMHERIALPELSISHILEVLYGQNIQSVIVEGGAKVLQAFIDANCWDEARVLTGTSRFLAGLKAPQLTGLPVSEESFGRDQIHYYRNR